MADVHLETRGKYFIFRNEPIAYGRRFGDSMNAGRPMELGGALLGRRSRSVFFSSRCRPRAAGRNHAYADREGAGNQKEGGQANGTRSPEETGGAGKA
jgi:hypothetical protein